VASNLNWVPGQTVPNRVIVPLAPDGKIDVFNALGTANVIIDVNGYFHDGGPGSGYQPNPPLRICDTRPAGPGVIANVCNDPSNGGPGALGQQEELTLTAPSGVSAAVFNVTIADEDAPTFLTVFPTVDPNNFTDPPVISDLNAVPGQVVANLVVVAAGTSQTITFFNKSGHTDIVVDLEGQYSTSTTPIT
jgi:hypothetical protein